VSTVEIDVEAWVKDDGRGMEQRNIYESAMMVMVMVMVMVMWDRQATKQAKMIKQRNMRQRIPRRLCMLDGALRSDRWDAVVSEEEG
jgi:hypothetical protein